MNNSIINDEIISTLKGYTSDMQNNVKFILQTGAHEKRDELKNFLKIDQFFHLYFLENRLEEHVIHF